ncbi:hypothetical protein J7E49_00280 [Variovorax paradoxus]|nr:hypothetical protein [Variovorax paradoxus]
MFVDGANRIKEERAHISIQAASGESATAYCRATLRNPFARGTTTPFHG